MHIRSFSQKDRLTLEEVPLPSSTSPTRLTLRALPGADSLHLTLSEADKVRHRVEIPVDDSEPVHVHLASEDGKDAHFTSLGRFSLTLPPDDRFEPMPPIGRPESPESLDVVLLVDGTTRVNLGELLLREEKVWKDLTEKIGAFLEALAESSPDLRLAVLAFGDQPMVRRDLPADDLQPRYHLYPQREEDRRLRHLGVEAALGELRNVPATSGGDFVDALADGLNAAGEMHWRSEARKLLFVVGDSPGPSIEHPLHPGGDICVRDRDVDVEARSLHRQGIEIATLYFDPSEEELGLEAIEAHELLQDTRRQYQRLASLPEMAFLASTFDPPKAAEHVLKRPELIARGSSYGELLEVRTEDADPAVPTPKTSTPPEPRTAGEPENAADLQVT